VTSCGIRFEIPEACEVDLYLIGGAGQIIKVFSENEHLDAGIHAVSFNWRDENGRKYPDGVYCWLLRAGDSEWFRCFKYDDLEDYLP